MNTNINLPIVIGFNDYHEIAAFRDKLQGIIPKITFDEIGHVDGKYKAIFYTRKDKNYRAIRAEFAEFFSDTPTVSTTNDTVTAEGTFNNTF